jgi:hypothetical protein
VAKTLLLRALSANYQRVLGPNIVNELRVGDTRRAVERSATSLPTSAGDAAVTLVQHRGVCGRAAVHARVGIA